jgi:hypothetical protein
MWFYVPPKVLSSFGALCPYLILDWLNDSLQFAQNLDDLLVVHRDSELLRVVES